MGEFNISVSSSSYLKDFKGIKKNISQLFELIPGEVVSDRDMGISRKAIDKKPDIARILFVEEVIEKIEKYEPRVLVDEIKVTNKFDVMYVDIKVIPNEEYEEGSDNEDEDD